MFDPQLIPSPNKALDQLLAKIISDSKSGAQNQKVLPFFTHANFPHNSSLKVAQTLLQRANNRFADAISKAPTVSEYLASLWNSKQIYQSQREVYQHQLLAII